MRAIVTGGAGFIGSNFCNMFAQQFELLVVLDSLTYAADRRYLTCDPSFAQFVEADICNRVAVNMILTTGKIDTIVHFAAESHVDRSIQSADKFISTNINGTFTLIDEFNRHRSTVKSPRFIHVSTDEVYGVAEGNSKFTESTPYAPNSPYAASKAASDLLVRSYIKTHNFPAIITHCSNNYGPHQASEKLIPTVIKCLVNRTPIPVYGNGMQIRDWVHVADHCRALWYVLTSGRLGETYNIGGDHELTNIQLINQLCDIYDRMYSPPTPSKDLITYVADRPGHDVRYSVDHTKISSELKWHPSSNVSELLSQTVEYYRNKFTKNLLEQNSKIK